MLEIEVIEVSIYYGQRIGSSSELRILEIPKELSVCVVFRSREV